METPENNNKSIDSLHGEAANVSQTKGGGPGDGYIPLEELATTDPDTFGKLHNALNSGNPASAGWAFENVTGRWEHQTGYYAYQIKTGFQGKEGMGDI
jgi:hypothetical protein